MKAPAMCPDLVNSIRMNLPNRDELLFRRVCAFPKASRIGFALRIWSSSVPSCRDDELSEATAAKYCMTFLVFSVFPAPDSPLLETLATLQARFLNYMY